MFKLFSRLFEEERKQIIAEPIVEAAPEPPPHLYRGKWREPVQSLIDSLEEGWWDYRANPNGTSSYLDFYYFKHEWLGTEFLLIERNEFLGRQREWSVEEDWLTEDEKVAVAESAKAAMKSLDKEKGDRRNNLRKQEFFKLVELKEKL